MNVSEINIDYKNFNKFLFKFLFINVLLNFFYIDVDYIYFINILFYFNYYILNIFL